MLNPLASSPSTAQQFPNGFVVSHSFQHSNCQVFHPAKVLQSSTPAPLTFWTAHQPHQWTEMKSTKAGCSSFQPHVHFFPQLSWASTPRGKASSVPHQFMPLDFLCVSSSQRSKDCCPSSCYFCQDHLPKRMMQLHWKASQTPHVTTFSASQSQMFYFPWTKVFWEAPPPIPTLCSGCHRLLLPILSLQYNPCNFNSWSNWVY